MGTASFFGEKSVGERGRTPDFPQKRYSGQRVKTPKNYFSEYFYGLICFNNNKCAQLGLILVIYKSLDARYTC